MRLTKQLQPPFVFVENVQNLKTTEKYWKVFQNTFTRIGYELSYIVLPGYSIGSPQKRSRLFVLAHRVGSLPPKMLQLTLHKKPYKWNVWKKDDPSKRLKLHFTLEDQKRDGAVGNCVIPDVGRAAFLILFSGFQIPFSKVKTAKTVAFSKGTVLPKGAVGHTTLAGIVSRGRDQEFAMTIPPPIDLGLLLVPRHPNPSAEKFHVRDIPAEPVTKMMWTTALASSCWKRANVMTIRTKNNLGTQLSFEQATPVSIRMGKTSPEWLEWFFGLPKNYTIPLKKM